MAVKDLLKKHGLKESDLVEIASGKTVLKGTIIPSKNPEILELKLSSGYNAGIIAKEISGIKKLGEGKSVSKAKTQSFPQKPGLPRIAILHTGGTIASRVDYRTGAVFSSFQTEDLLTMFSELHAIANISSEHLSNMWSEDMRFDHYKIMAKAVEKEVKKGVDGIIIAHGTDTMHYSSAALAFALENVPVPVILVGAQRSSDRGSSDAAMNLVCAATFMAKTDFAGVAICMHHSASDDSCAILPACKTRKMHTSRRDAFKAVNGKPIALVDFRSRNVEFIEKNFAKKGAGKLAVKDKFEEKTGILKAHTNMFAEEIDFYRKQKYKGLILEGFALGQFPIAAPNPQAKKNLEVKKALEKLIKSGCVVVMASQCIFGRVHMHVYDKAVDLQNMGVVPAEDMTSETAFIKLAWLLGNYPKKEVAALVGKNLRGEISDRTEFEEQFPGD
ncbi:MAG: Glu-tRNA(Gln) amidotransferase subunit GatD [Candidatus Diapherotrites archaeon]|nr:Glu-tRNA(Gln) amidotransferase subunit GatD [Candidatus Diapherotrites archaeon]